MNILGWHNNAYKWDYNFFISDSFLEANFLTKEIVTIVNVFHNKPHKHKMSLKVLLANKSSVDSFALTILQSRVQIPCTPSMLVPFMFKFWTPFVIVLSKGG